MSFETTCQFGDLVLAGWWAPAPEQAEPLPTVFALARLRDVAFSDGANQLLTLADALDGTGGDGGLNGLVHRLRLEAALHRIEEALDRGELTAFEILRPWSRATGGSDARAPDRIEAASPAPAASSTADWVEFALVGEDGTPVANERYVVVLPGGEERTGRLDGQGRARIDGIGAGECAFTLPRLDRDAWERAEVSG